MKIVKNKRTIKNSSCTLFVTNFRFVSFQIHSSANSKSLLKANKKHLKVKWESMNKEANISILNSWRKPEHLVNIIINELETMSELSGTVLGIIVKLVVEIIQ